MRRYNIPQKYLPKIHLPVGVSVGICIMLVSVYPFFIAFYSISQNTNELASLCLTAGFILLGSGVLLTCVSSYLSTLKDKKEKALLLQSKIDDTDKMNGREFEKFLAAVFEKAGYAVKLTKTSGDFGADLILTKDITRIAVQAKRSSSKISVSAVQEVSASKAYYNCNNAWVVTNSYFTKPATVLASQNGIKLIDRSELMKLIVEIKNAEEKKDANAA